VHQFFVNFGSRITSIKNGLAELWENMTLKCSKISTFRNCEIKTQQKYILQ